MTIPGIGNSANWDLFWNFSASAGGIPIPDQVSPLVASGSLIAVYADSEKAKNTWHTAGYLSQRIHAGLKVSPFYDLQLAGRVVYLRRVQLIDFKEYAEEYELRFSVVRWLRQVQVSVWIFRG